MKTTLKLRSGNTIPCIDPNTAQKKNYLSRNEINQLHLMPSGEPVAFSENVDGSVKYYSYVTIKSIQEGALEDKVFSDLDGLYEEIGTEEKMNTFMLIRHRLSKSGGRAGMM